MQTYYTNILYLSYHLDNKRGANDEDEYENDPSRKIEQAIYELGNKVR